jgi:hypothetical protein
VFVAFAHGVILCGQVGGKKGQWQKSAPESGLAMAGHLHAMAQDIAEQGNDAGSASGWPSTLNSDRPFW